MSEVGQTSLVGCSKPWQGGWLGGWARQVLALKEFMLDTECGTYNVAYVRPLKRSPAPAAPLVKTVGVYPYMIN